MPHATRAVLASLLLLPAAAVAQAPLRDNQPYAEADRCAQPDVLFCEDFNYPDNFFYAGSIGTNDSEWRNPGLTTQVYGFSYGLDGRRINPRADYTAKPDGDLPSGTQADHVWVANWDASKGGTGTGSTWGYLRQPGGNYANGSAPATDLYFRMRYFVTEDYVWPGDPRSDVYDYGNGCQPYDNKIFYVFPPEGIADPTSAAYDAGLHTQAGIYDPDANARFADALAVRYGNSSDNYKYFPMCSACAMNPSYYEYAPFQSLALRNPGDTPREGKIFRFDANRWYTLEMRYKLSSVPDASDGAVEVWVDGVKVYSELALPTCGGGTGDCSGIGLIDIVAYHNDLDCTAWDGQQIIDDLIISRSYIGPPNTGIPNPNGDAGTGLGESDPSGCCGVGASPMAVWPGLATMLLLWRRRRSSR